MTDFGLKNGVFDLNPNSTGLFATRNGPGGCTLYTPFISRTTRATTLKFCIEVEVGNLSSEKKYCDPPGTATSGTRGVLENHNSAVLNRILGK